MLVSLAYICGMANRLVIDIYQEKERPNKASLRDATGKGLHSR